MSNCEFCKEGKCRAGEKATFCDWSTLSKNRESILERIELLEGHLRKLSTDLLTMKDKEEIRKNFLIIADESEACKQMIEILRKEFQVNKKIDEQTSIAVLKAVIHNKKNLR